MSSRAISKFVRLGTGKDLVVGVIGWQRARAHRLKKYAELYNKRGYDTIQFTGNSPVPWFSYIESRDTEELAKDVEKVRREGRRLAWHMFSLNSSAVLVSLDKTYPHLKAIGGSEGIFFDSSVIPFGFSSIQMALDVVMPKKRYNNAIRMAYKANIAALFANLEIRRKLGLKVGDYGAYDYLVEHEGIPRHLAVVYSDADVISDSKLIAEFVALQREKGREVDELRFTDSPHLEHFAKHPKEYEELINRFIYRIEGKKAD